MIIYYQSHYCVLDKEACKRGSKPECPEKKQNLEVPCSFFKAKGKDK